MKTSNNILNIFTIALLMVSSAAWAASAVLPDQTIMGSPVIGAPIQHPTTKSCKIAVVKDFAFDAFGKISELPYQPPSDCPPPWSKIILEMDGRIEGAQYDRYGFIWLGQAELLRFTTPEPPHHAIHWHIEKDITQYSSLFTNFKNPQNFIAQLDNATTAKLNGVYRISANITFYEADKKFPAKPQANIIKTITSGQKNQPYFTLTPTPPATLAAVTQVNLPTNITRAYLEMYATPHGNEEFWYLPGGNSAAYRELQIYIDGKLAGIVWPFPYIYTGGFTPHLWTPIPAIEALNIPPYVIDLTPFAGLLNKPSNPDKDNTHKISIKLNVVADYWLIDANLLLYTDSAKSMIEGDLTNYPTMSSATISASQNYPYSKDYQNRDITRSVSWSGYVKTSQGEVATTLKQNFSLNNIFPRANGLNHLMRQHIDSETIINNKSTAIQTDYEFLISPNLDNMNTSIPVPFLIKQTLQKTQAALSTFYEEVNSSITLNTDDLKSYLTNATTFYQDLDGKCFYQHLEAKNNLLTAQVTHDILKSTGHIDIKNQCNGNE